MKQKDDRKKLLLGASGYVGRYLLQECDPTQILATYNHQPIEGGVHFDSLSMELSDIVKNPNEFSHAILLLGDTNPETCAADREHSQALNVDSTIAILKTLFKWQIKPIFFSTEFIFDGEKGNYSEEDPPSPILTYGKQKFAVEKFLEGSGQDYVTLRLAKVFGPDPGDGSLLANWLNTLQQGEKSFRVAADQIFSPVYVGDVVKAILHFTQAEGQGTYHVAGPRALKRIEILEVLLEKLKKHFSTEIELIPCSIHDFPLEEKRPLNVSMTCEKLEQAMGCRMTDLESACEALLHWAFVKAADKRHS